MEPSKAMLCLAHSSSNNQPPTNTIGFYLVWNPDRGLPKKRHPTLKSAQNEAERLAKKQPNESFYVLQTVSVDRSYFKNVAIRKETTFHHEESEVIPNARRCN